MDSSLVDKALNVHSRNAFRIIVRLVNETAMAQAFKVKTTGPQRWSVKPNSGVLCPGEHAELTFLRFTMR